MEAKPLTVIDILKEVSGYSDYINFPLAGVNNHIVRVGVMTEPYFWHYHPNSDETFLVMEGIVIIDLEDKTIELHAGQLFTIPKNVKHRTRPKGDRSVNITFELGDMETVRVDVI
jgi:mannose-6-phosphate isomerase-like protein (cupin superfamily)